MMIHMSRLTAYPGEGFPADVRRVNGLAEGEPLIVVPPLGRRGAESLSDDRLAASELVAGLRTSFGGVAFRAERGGEPVNSMVAFPSRGGSAP